MQQRRRTRCYAHGDSRCAGDGYHGYRRRKPYVRVCSDSLRARSLADRLVAASLLAISAVAAATVAVAAAAVTVATTSLAAAFATAFATTSASECGLIF